MRKFLFFIAVVYLIQCKSNINYYQGFIYDMNNNPVINLKVYEKHNKENYSLTNKKGYFKIYTKRNNIKRFLYVKLNESRIIDSIQITGIQGGERIKYSFIEGRKDTLFITLPKQLNIAR